MRESEEKQRRAKEAREKAEVEKAARAERKRALVDMNAHETQEGVMDSLMEALQNGSAFSRPDQRRKRQTRVAGGKFKLVRNIHSNSVTIVRRKSSVHRNFTRIEPNSMRNVNNDDYFTPEDNNQQFIKNLMLKEAMKTPRKNQFENKSRLEIVDFIRKEKFYTPEENQSRIKNILLSHAEKAPKKNDVIYKMSRIFKNNKTPNSLVSASELEETPKRNISISTNSSQLSELSKNYDFHTPSPKNYYLTGHRNESYDSVIKELKITMPEGNELNPSENVRKVFIVGKRKKKNSFIRRAVVNRRKNSRKHRRSLKLLSNNHHCHDEFRSNINTNLDENENFFTPNRFFLGKNSNYDNDIDENDDEDDNSELRENSSLAVVNNFPGKFSPIAKHYRGSITSQSSEEKKKTWKLWKKLGDSAKSVKRKYNIKQSTESEIGK